MSPIAPVTLVAFCAVLATAAAIDLRSRRIPNWLTYPAICAALAVAALDGRLAPALAGATVGALLFILPIFLYGRKGAGGGDVKLAAFIGSVLGVSGTLAALFVAGLVATAVLAVGIASGRLTRRTPVPFGPFLAVGAICAVLF
jgi:prepilin signal peptidase PulO-like enzyme (type II secretory pathway)